MFRYAGSIALVAAGSSLLGGCAALGAGAATPPVSVIEVVQMTEKGLPAETIIQKMRAGNGVYRLDAAQLAQLHDRGVADPVLNYMQHSYLNTVRRDQSRIDWDEWTMWGKEYQ